MRACVSTPGVMPTYPLVAIPPVPCPFFSFIYLFKVEKKEKKNKRQGNRCAQHLDTRASSSPTVFIFIFWKVLFLSSSFVFFPFFSLILLWCNTKTVSKPVHPRHLLGIDLEPCVLTGRLPWNVFFMFPRSPGVCRMLLGLRRERKNFFLFLQPSWARFICSSSSSFP